MPNREFFNKRAKVAILIAIALLILLQINSVIQKDHTFDNNQHIILSPFVWQSTSSCWSSQGRFRFKIANCEQFADGTVLSVIGSLDPDSDDGFFQQKSLIQTSYIVVNPSPFSFLHWSAQSQQLMRRLRTWILTPIRQTVSYPEEVLVESFVLGSTVDLPEEIKQSVKVMGIAHVIAVSGSHLTLLISLLILLIRTRNSTINTFILVLCLFLYTALVGWQPAVSRALLMSVVILLGKAIFHRQVSLSRSLLVSGACMLALNPWVFLNIGWQLSMLATAGIIWLYPLLNRATASLMPVRKRLTLEENAISLVAQAGEIARRILRLSLEAVLASLAALACIWPIMIGNFGSWSWGTILSSLLFWWLFPLVISSCFIGVIGVRLLSVLSIHPSIVQICSSLLLEWPVRGITWLFDQMSALEWLVVTTGEWPKSVFYIWYLVLSVALIIDAYFVRHRRQRLHSLLQPLKYRY